MNAQRSLMNSSNALQEAMERLSTGKKINSAADDAAGFRYRGKHDCGKSEV
jgi:flagellin